MTFVFAIVTALCAFLPTHASAQSIDEARELLKQSFECAPSIYNLGDIVISERLTLDASQPGRLKLLTKVTEAQSKKKTTTSESVLVANFGDLGPATLVREPIREGHSARGVQLICKAGKKCISVDDQDQDRHTVYVCDLKTAENGLLAVNAMAGLAAALPIPPPIVRSGRCVVADPTGTPLNIRKSPGGPIDGTVSNGAVVRIETTVKDSGGREWAKVRFGDDSFYLFRRYLNCE